MTTLSKRQLNARPLARPVFVVGGGMVPLAACHPDSDAAALCGQAYAALAADVGWAPDVLRRYVDHAVYTYASRAHGDGGPAAIHDHLGLLPLGRTGVRTGETSGASAALAAVHAIAAGASDCTLVFGWRRVETPDEEGRGGHVGPQAAAPARAALAGRDESFRRAAAGLVVRAREAARHSPLSQAREPVTLEDVLESPVIDEPLRALDRCLTSSGAVCLLLAERELAHTLVPDPVRLVGAQGSGAPRGADLDPLRRAASVARAMAGPAVEPPDVVELSDAFAPAVLLMAEALGVDPERTPLNPGGGPWGLGHSGPLTGLAQILECTWQLKGACDAIHGDPARWEAAGLERPADWRGHQVDGARRALAAAQGAADGHAVVFLLGGGR